jgi:hypothetical protein
MHGERQGSSTLITPFYCCAADEVRAAASAALKALPAGRSTVFFVDTSEESGGADEGEHAASNDSRLTVCSAGCTTLAAGMLSNQSMLRMCQAHRTPL